MTRTLDGLNFDFPPRAAQVVELAHQHRRNLDEAILHQDIHLGRFCLLQRKRVYDFTRDLDKQQRRDFYEVYNGELQRIAHDDELHPADAERGVGAFAIFLSLVVIALVLYFAVIRNTIG